LRRYISLARFGVSESELFELLSLSDDVLAEVCVRVISFDVVCFPSSRLLLCSYVLSVPTDRTMPTCAFLLLLDDMQPLLTRQGTPGHGRSLISWANITCVWRVRAMQRYALFHSVTIDLQLQACSRELCGHEPRPSKEAPHGAQRVLYWRLGLALQTVSFSACSARALNFYREHP
jgi:hypothetical protein